MCGVAGILHRDGRPIDRESQGRMARAIAHRGPDGEGIHVDDGCPSIGLAARRLAVIDVQHGSQPMSTEDGCFTIVYNGEIFNAVDLRRELEGLGHRFRSRCDTEVILRGYAQWGPEVVARLNGMWAFAVWDRRTRGLFVTRDRLGVKPLVYADTANGFVFASEIKGLLASGLVDPEIDLTALEFTELRSLAGANAGKGPGPESSLLKIKGSEIQQRLTELTLEAVGHYGAPYFRGFGEGDNEHPIGPDYAHRAAPTYFNMRKTTIYGGSNEIQRNIIAKMVLGL